jgi:thiamine biosynthesis lipoprotein ApbE
VEIEVPGHLVLIGIDEGGVATSTPRAGAGIGGNGICHRLVDPRSGAVLPDAPLSVTVVAPDGWLAEVWTKAIARDRWRGLWAAQEAGLGALFVGDDGTVEMNQVMEFLVRREVVPR